jgi:ABC-2 type transport system permease protein
MLSDIQTIMWKEWRELFTQRASGKSSVLTFVIIIGVLGIVLPLQIGKDWLTSPLAIALSAWIPITLVNSVIVESFAGERERHTLETLLASRLSDRAILVGKIAAGLSYGWGLTLIIFVVQAVAVNVASSEGQLVFYQGSIGISSIVISSLTACLAANIGVLISLRAPSTRQAQQTLSIATIALFLIPVLGLRAMPTSWRGSLSNILSTGGINVIVMSVVIFFLMLNILFFVITSTQFRRTRLILSM